MPAGIPLRHRDDAGAADSSDGGEPAECRPPRALRFYPRERPAVFEPERDELATPTRLTAKSRVAVARAKAIDWLPARVSISSESGPRT